ncbi:MAG: cell division protein ZapA [Brevundimonas sp.]|jgi:cell division protein ZapA|uniref:cell division protein ZapA n=1 Tax=Brevundimonas sp. TaxID=1871086 RepID=UPI00391B4BBE
MATVTVQVNGRPYAVGCADGQEERVRALARMFDQQVAAVARDVGQVGDIRLFLMAALILADELHEARHGGQGEAPAPGTDFERRAALAIEDAAVRIERLAARL